LGLFPERRFVLVGDSGEKDPEVYSKLAARFPERVVAILIREVSGRDLDTSRFEPPLPESVVLCVFRSPSELAGFQVP
jgi:phosphatidate phosphatase APP1